MGSSGKKFFHMKSATCGDISSVIILNWTPCFSNSLLGSRATDLDSVIFLTENTPLNIKCHVVCCIPFIWMFYDFDEVKLPKLTFQDTLINNKISFLSWEKTLTHCHGLDCGGHPGWRCFVQLSSTLCTVSLIFLRWSIINIWCFDCPELAFVDWSLLIVLKYISSMKFKNNKNNHCKGLSSNYFIPRR